MAYFIVRITMYTIAAALVMSIVPGLRLVPNPSLPEPFATLFAYGIIGLIFGTLHSFLRPIILFLTGRLYIWSMGLLALVTDTFIFLLLSYLSPTVWEIGAARLFSAILGAMLMGVVVLGMEALFGFDAPRAVEVRKTPAYWRWLGMLPTGWRNRIVENLRILQMVNTIQSYVIDILVGLTPLRDFRRAMQKLLYRRHPRLMENDPAVKVRLMLQELGPTFVKFGQMAASRIETLPAAWQTELARLQDDVKPFPYTEVEQVILKELGKPPESVFATFDTHPQAAASTAQVHAATLHTGERVVVKVRRPNIEVTVKGDLNVMQDVLDTVERRVTWVRQFGLGALFNEFAENLQSELDYANEAYHARLLRHNMQKFSFVRIPKIYGLYSTSKILTQERVEGVKISDVAALNAAGINREELALNFFRALLQQLLFDGFFHADLHPGNIWVNLETRCIIFLDMGLMGYLTRADRFAIGELIWALQDRDARAVARVMVTICKPAQGFDRIAFERDVERLINSYLLLEDSTLDITKIVHDLVGLLFRYDLKLRGEFALAFKAIGQGESIMRTLMGDKPLDYILNVAVMTMKELLLAQLKPEKVRNFIGKPLARDLIGRLPELLSATSTLLDDFQNGQSLFQLNLNSIDQRVSILQTGIDSGIRRIILSVLLIGLLLGSTLTLLVPIEGRVGEFEELAIRLVAESGFVIGAVLITSMLLYTLWQTILKPKQT